MKKWTAYHSRHIIAFIFLLSAIWGLGRLYFSVTDGFQMENIVSDLPFDASRATRSLSEAESQELNLALSQPYRYLGKGCQSYVFISEDQRYVLKFFKYQRFRLSPWIKAFSFIPAVKNYLDEKIEKKQKRLAFFMQAWKVAFDELKEESGLIAVHLNKSHDLKKDFVLYDKLGMKHVFSADSLEFLIQRKADSLVPWIQKEMAHHRVDKVKDFLDEMTHMLLSEYARGLSDNDHALMQNTGLFQNHPFHIDVGQFNKDPRFLDPSYWHQHFYNKTFRLRVWLLQNYPELGEYFIQKLQQIIGDDWANMKAYYGHE